MIFLFYKSTGALHDCFSGDWDDLAERIDPATYSYYGESWHESLYALPIEEILDQAIAGDTKHLLYLLKEYPEDLKNALREHGEAYS